MNKLDRHRIIHLVAAKGFDARTVAKVLDGVAYRKNIISERIRTALVELGVEIPAAHVQDKAA